MSHSAPSESSAVDTMFVVGADLVEFDRRDLPIYLTPETRWAEACHGDTSYGAPLDRLFGEPGDVFVDAAVDDCGGRLATSFGEDPLVGLASLCDGLILAPSEAAGAALEVTNPPSSEIAAIYDYGADPHAVVHLHDDWSWDAAGAEWALQVA